MDDATTIAGRYVVLRQLGIGGMGTVVLARDERLRREVAIKRVHATGGADAQKRLQREAKLGASLTHPALVTVFDTLTEDASLIIVMEHVAGETLADRLERGPLDPQEAVAVLRPVAGALDHAHKNGIVHRDVKPANILIGERGAVKLADLGVAVTDDASHITQEDAMVGSLPYMAPEQLEPGRVGPAADVFALASVAFEALTGRRARTGGTPLAIVREAQEGEPPTAPELPRAAAAVLAAGMARRPEDRPVTATVFVQELEAALAPASETTRERPAPVVPRPPPARPAPPAPARSRPRRGAAIAGVLGLLAVAVLALVLLAGDDDTAPRETADRPEKTATATATATASPAPAGAPADDDPSTPTGAVRAFYERAARDDFAGAFALAGPRMRSALGGTEASLAANLGSLESIRFRTLTAEGESDGGTTVRIATVARHTDRTDRCRGTLLAVPDGAGGYRVDPAGVSCTRA